MNITVDETGACVVGQQVGQPHLKCVCVCVFV